MYIHALKVKELFKNFLALLFMALVLLFGFHNNSVSENGQTKGRVQGKRQIWRTKTKPAVHIGQHTQIPCSVVFYFYVI